MGDRSTGCCFVHIACLFTWEEVSSPIITDDWSSLTMEDGRPQSFLLHANTAGDKIPFGRTPARLPGFERISDRTGHLSVHGGGYQIRQPGLSHPIPRKPVPTKSLPSPTGSELTKLPFVIHRRGESMRRDITLQSYTTGGSKLSIAYSSFVP